MIFVRLLLITSFLVDGAIGFVSPSSSSHSRHSHPSCPTIITSQHFRSAAVPSSITNKNFQSTSTTKKWRMKHQDNVMVLCSSNNNERYNDNVDNNNNNNKLDQILSKLTSAFPLFVLSFAIMGYFLPSSLQWVNRGNYISLMLALVMCGTGVTLEKDDFISVYQEEKQSVPMGIICQFGIMPLSAYIIGKILLFSDTSSAIGKALFLGLCLVGCSPGGTASNLVSLIAKANVALSVLLTSCSTIMATVMTPLLIKLLIGSTVAISGWTLCSATAKVVLGPVLFGMAINSQTPQLAKSISRFTPFASVLLVSLICGGVVAQNVSTATAAVSISGPWLIRMLSSILLLHCSGFFFGYLVPKLIDKRTSTQTARTISIETGMQNSALAIVLARSINADPLSSLPGSLSATIHSCLGSILAALWRMNVNDNKKDQSSSSSSSTCSTETSIYERTRPEDNNDMDSDPSLMI